MDAAECKHVVLDKMYEYFLDEFAQARANMKMFWASANL